MSMLTEVAQKIMLNMLESNFPMHRYKPRLLRHADVLFFINKFSTYVQSKNSGH